MRPLVRHGRLVSLVGGLLVVAIGLAMMFDLLVLLPRYFQFALARMSDGRLAEPRAEPPPGGRAAPTRPDRPVHRAPAADRRWS